MRPLYRPIHCPTADMVKSPVTFHVWISTMHHTNVCISTTAVGKGAGLAPTC
eukprot:COSAG01_NODE_53647_length_337_cov_1.647059_1_plen_51_part_10